MSSKLLLEQKTAISRCGGLRFWLLEKWGFMKATDVYEANENEIASKKH